MDGTGTGTGTVFRETESERGGCGNFLRLVGLGCWTGVEACEGEGEGSEKESWCGCGCGWMGGWVCKDECLRHV